MIISDSHKFVFIHNPKCAGTTVRRSLLQFDTRFDYYWMYGELFGRKVDKAHLPYDLACAFDPSVGNAIEKYTTFGFVRNPISRTFSAFNEVNKKLLKEANQGGDNFKLYVNSLNQFVMSLNSDNVSGLHVRYRHFVRQSDMFYSGSKSIADKVIKLEEIGDARNLNSLCCLIPALSDVISEWSSKKKNIKEISFSRDEVLSEAAVNHIREIYSRDFDLFGY